MSLRQIIIRKKSKALMGAGIGLLGGALLGGTIGYATADKSDMFGDLNTEMGTAIGTGIGALAGGLFGVCIGIMSSKEKYMPADMNQTGQDYLLKKLKSKFRFGDEVISRSA